MQEVVVTMPNGSLFVGYIAGFIIRLDGDKYYFVENKQGVFTFAREDRVYLKPVGFNEYATPLPKRNLNLI